MLIALKSPILFRTSPQSAFYPLNSPRLCALGELRRSLLQMLNLFILNFVPINSWKPKGPGCLFKEKKRGLWTEPRRAEEGSPDAGEPLQSTGAHRADSPASLFRLIFYLRLSLTCLLSIRLKEQLVTNQSARFTTALKGTKGTGSQYLRVW